MGNSYGPLSYLVFTEKDTRDNFIDKMLSEQGWKLHENYEIESRVSGNSTQSGIGFSDYVLYDKDHTVLAVVEAKRTSINPEAGLLQAQEYADYYQSHDSANRRPVVFLTNGVKLMILDNISLRPIHGFYSQSDLHTYHELSRYRADSLTSAEIKESIAGRPYQIQAIKHVKRQYSEGRRKNLLIMATGSGKTRVAASISDIFLNYGWAKNVLFFADRKKLVTQAYGTFDSNLHSYDPTMVYGDNPSPNYKSRIVISTYPSMASLLNRDGATGRIYSPGHFQLVILDEVHRSVYEKYRAVFEYFDAYVLGLTATPRNSLDEISTFELFDIDDRSSVYEYSYDEGVKQGVLKPFNLTDVDMKFNREGIRFSDLTLQEQERFKYEFMDENGIVPDFIPPQSFYRKVISRDSIRKVIQTLWEKGIRVDEGATLGKTIIFATTHQHAEAIRDEFYAMLPNQDKDACVVIDYKTSSGSSRRRESPDSLMKKFEDKDSTTRIAISVDMLDTGVDIPCILNLVFFKPIYSRIKFWQMIGRGTRPCDDLIDGMPKDHFQIFDFCGNFEYFDEHPEGVEPPSSISVSKALFIQRSKMIIKLQSGQFSSPEYAKMRSDLVNDELSDVRGICLNNFDIGLDRAFIQQFSDESSFQMLTDDDLDILTDHVASHIECKQDDVNKLRFDNLMMSICNFVSDGIVPRKHISDLVRKASYLYNRCYTLANVKSHDATIRRCMDRDYLVSCSVMDFEKIRQELRDLMNLIEKEEKMYTTNLSDDIRSIEDKGFELPEFQYTDYKKKVRNLIESHMDYIAIQKIHTNQPLDGEDLQELEDILWTDPESKSEFELEFKDVSVKLLVRQIVGLDREAAYKIFAKYLSLSDLSDSQMYFLNEIIEHVVMYGVVDKKKLSGKPFINKGSINQIFKEDHDVLDNILKAVQEININVDYDGTSPLVEV
ncbi:MAG: DEAD/DEAH box helicase [Thermoplasmata archaeon]|nr:DEAD/DEAH box helicase [Thermoplasmata archaeon]